MTVNIEDNLPNIRDNGLNTAKNAILGGTVAVTGAATLASTLAVTGAITATGGVTGPVTSTGAFIGGTQALSGAGAVDIVSLTTKVTSTGANALTLANGADGQIKFIVMVVDGGDATLTPTTKTGFSTIVFNDIGDGVGLVYTTTTGWIVFANNGATIS